MPTQSQSNVVKTVSLFKKKWESPFADRQAWLQFIDKTKDTRLSRSYEALFNDAQISAYIGQINVETNRIQYCSDKLKINGFMITPHAPGKYLIIIYNHGGVMQWGRITFPELMELHRIAERGYVILASYYRGEGGSDGQADMGGGDVNDVLALMKLTATLPKADPQKIGMWGFSRGAGVTYGVLKHSQQIKAAIVMCGASDHLNSARLAEFDEHVYPFAIRGYLENKEETLKNISPIHYIDRINPTTPILLLHGANDVRADARSSLDMATEFHKRKRPYRLKIYEHGTHDLLEHFHNIRLEMDQWFDQLLRNIVFQ